MHNKIQHRASAVALAGIVTAISLAASNPAFAAATAEEIKQLGTTLTPWGAEKAGNKEGTIPAYTGPIKPPASYNPAKPGIRPDPFAAEKPLFSIDAKNADKHADKLSEGMKQMFKKYPTFRMDIYQSHRTATYPQFVLDNTLKNASQCKTAGDGLQLVNCFAGFPFPFPKTGNEVMWNRLWKYDAQNLESDGMAGRVVDINGNTTLTGIGKMWIHYPIYDPKKTTPVALNEPYEKIRIDFTDPARKAGEKLIILDPVDMVNSGRKAYSYLPGQRRVKLAPDISYDTPSPTGGGAGNVDEAAVWYGSLDRYNFKLIGKKEMYIPYNAYRIRDASECPSKISMKTKNHLNPDCMRWELHRVWMVEATLKEGKRNAYTKRTLYWDEDLPGVGMSDNYDSTGAIYRISHSIPITLYETQGHSTDEWVTYDLATGNYSRQQDVTDSGGWIVTPSKPSDFFSSEGLAGSGVR